MSSVINTIKEIASNGGYTVTSTSNDPSSITIVLSPKVNSTGFLDSVLSGRVKGEFLLRPVPGGVRFYRHASNNLFASTSQYPTSILDMNHVTEITEKEYVSSRMQQFRDLNGDVMPSEGDYDLNDIPGLNGIVTATFKNNASWRFLPDEDTLIYDNKIMYRKGGFARLIPRPKTEILRAGYGDDPVFMFRILNGKIEKEEHREFVESITTEIDKILLEKFHKNKIHSK